MKSLKHQHGHIPGSASKKCSWDRDQVSELKEVFKRCLELMEDRFHQKARGQTDTILKWIQDSGSNNQHTTGNYRKQFPSSTTGNKQKLQCLNKIKMQSSIA